MRMPILLAAMLLALPAGEALAHARLLKADPAPGSVLAHPPRQLVLRFSEVIRPKASGVRLTAPDGKSTVLGPLMRDPKDPDIVVVQAPADLGPGRYNVEWKALSPDGHHTQGTFGFSVGP
jgi:hypothetical protein